MNNQMQQFLPQQPVAPKKKVDKEGLIKKIRILCLAALLALFAGTLNPLLVPASSSTNMLLGHSVINYTVALTDKVDELNVTLNDKMDGWDYDDLEEFIEEYTEEMGLGTYTIQLVFSFLVMAALIVVVVGLALSFKKSKAWPLLTAIGSLAVVFFSLIDSVYNMIDNEDFTFYIIPVLISWAVYIILAIFCFKYGAADRASASVTYAMPNNAYNASFNASQKQPPMPAPVQYQAPVNTAPEQPMQAAPAPAPMPEHAPAPAPAQRVCKKCGQPLNDGFVFCTSCGTKN